MAPRETENNACAKIRGDKQRALWYFMVFSAVVNNLPMPSYAIFIELNINSLHGINGKK